MCPIYIFSEIFIYADAGVQVCMEKTQGNELVFIALQSEQQQALWLWALYLHCVRSGYVVKHDALQCCTVCSDGHNIEILSHGAPCHKLLIDSLQKSLASLAYLWGQRLLSLLQGEGLPRGSSEKLTLDLQQNVIFSYLVSFSSF